MNALPNYLTTKQFAAKHQAFALGGLQANIFHEKTNGMKAQGVIVRNGRRVLINEAKFFAWLENKQA